MKAHRDELTGRWHTDLPDVFDTICQKLRNREPFSFARYGDGEWNAIYGKKGANCDGHEYFMDMGARLRRIVESKPSYMMGLQPLTVASDRMKQIENDFPGIDWVDADSIHNASIDGKLSVLINSLPMKDVVLIGPKHLMPLAALLGWWWCIVPDLNCWNEFERTHNYISDRLEDGPKVVLLCASMMSEVIIDEFHGEATLIDIGSVLDPYCGVKSRRYHHKLMI